jgi:hypothetical protein
MRTIIFPAATATIAFSAILALAPAQADDIHGGPIKNGSQCFRYSASFERDARFGSWAACPQTASVAAAPATNSRRVRGAAVPAADIRPVRAAVAPSANSHPVRAVVAPGANSHHVRIAVAPTTHLVGKDQMTEIRHLKMKIGDAEFEADVPGNRLQAMYDEFLSSLKQQGRTAEQKPDIETTGGGPSAASSR